MLRKLKTSTVDKVWYEDEDWDVVIWLEKGLPHGFQISYDKNEEEKALTFTKDAFHHGLVDTGNDDHEINHTPIISEGRVFDGSWFQREIVKRGDLMDVAHRDFILEKLKNS